MQRKFERRAAAMLAVLAFCCPGMGFSQTPSPTFPAPAEKQDAPSAPLTAQFPPPTGASAAAAPIEASTAPAAAASAQTLTAPAAAAAAPIEASTAPAAAASAQTLTAPAAAPIQSSTAPAVAAPIQTTAAPAASASIQTSMTPAAAPTQTTMAPAAAAAPIQTSMTPAAASSQTSLAPASAPSAPTTSTLGSPAAATASKPSVMAPAGPADVGSDYVLGSADKIRLTVFGEPSLTGEYFVSSSGVVSLPLAGEVQAAGLTLRDFHDRVVKVLQDGYLKDPKVSLEVLTFRPFYILGEVSKPGQYPYTSGLTVFNAVATAGGFTYRANTHKVLIKRATESSEHEVTLNSETTLAPGDTIRILERFF